MQAVVESASGQSYESYLTEHVWGPAGMVNTQLDVPARVVRHRGHGYIWNPKRGMMENAPNEDVSYKYAGGGVLSSDEDLVRFGHALNRGLLLRPETIAEMYRLQLPPDLPRFEDTVSPPVGAMQALVFRVGKNALGHVYARHSGSVKGTTTEFINFFADDVVVALSFQLRRQFSGHRSRGACLGGFLFAEQADRSGARDPTALEDCVRTLRGALRPGVAAPQQIDR